MFRSNFAPDLKPDHSSDARRQKGITGLETAIVLIAFVVVASVFAFTILSAGVFSSEANKQTIHAGLKETRTGLRQHGSAFAFAGYENTTQAVFKIVFIVSNSLAGEPVDLTPPYTADDSATDPDVDSAANSATIISYADEDQRFSDLPWSQVFIGNNNGDDLLEDGEKAEITVWLMDRITGTAVVQLHVKGHLPGARGETVIPAGAHLVRHRDIQVDNCGSDDQYPGGAFTD